MIITVIITFMSGSFVVIVNLCITINYHYYFSCNCCYYHHYYKYYLISNWVLRFWLMYLELVKLTSYQTLADLIL